MTLATKNIEPIPGYTLRERLGAGGYGEVWKADVPGGLSKAVKLVYGQLDGDRASNELKALNRIKTLRHPFLLSLERIEVVDGQLLIVTELADCSLKDLFDKRRAEGLTGIPRGELMQYMRDAADALDYINEHHSLQHLDVKPENLLLIGGHVKVADFGLVKDVHEGAVSVMGGLTPLYAAPELFNGSPSRRSDQYSLAILFQFMLTGTHPFPGKTTSQLANQHLNARPLVSSLPPGDRKVVARALAKDPQKRFANCREMVDFLQNELLQNAIPAADSWFVDSNESHVSVPVGMVNATIRLGTQVSANVPDDNPLVTSVMAQQDSSRSSSCSSSNDWQANVSNSDRIKAMGAAPASEKPAVRRSNDMFDDLDEAEQICNTDFVDTRILREQEAVKLLNVDAPVLGNDVSLRPTVIVGVGRVAGIVLQKLKRQMVDRLGAKACPAVEFLLLDTDGSDLQRACRGEDGASLASHEVLHMPLRKSQDYRSDGQALLSWISRRWLFNIPRSQKTEGLRPLGRLALVDHARNVHARLKKALQRVAAVENIAAANETAEIPFGGNPRVVIVGASCGGTAGGMLLDVGLIARQMLDRLGWEDREVTGVLLHYLGRNSSTHELAMVNSYATLSELAYYSRADVAYPGDGSCGLEPRQQDQSPFKQTYLIPLGEHLSDEKLASSVEPVADYLFLDTLTSAAEFFHACREKSHDAPGGMTVGGFSSYRLGASSSSVIPWATMSVCADLLARWVGDGHEKLAEFEAKAEQEMLSLVEARNFSYSALTERLLGELNSRLQRSGEPKFQSLIRSADKPLNATQLLQLDFRTILAQVNETLGKRECNSLGHVASWPTLLNEMAASMAMLAEAETTNFVEYLNRSLEQPGLRTCGTQRAHAVLMKHLSALNSAARDQRSQLEDQCSKLERMLGLEDTPSTVKNNPIRKSSSEYEKHFDMYIQTRVFVVVTHFLQALFRRMSSALTKYGEHVGDVRREVKGLLGKMHPGEFHAEDSNAVDSALRTVIANQFQERRPELVEKLDQWLQDRLAPAQESFLVKLAKGDEQRSILLKEMVDESRRCVMAALSDIDLATFLLADKEARLAGCVNLARPQPSAHAECRTLLTLSALSGSEEQKRQIAAETQLHLGAIPAVIVRNVGDFSVVTELSGMAVNEIAQRLIEFRPDIAEYAARIYSRNDIPFEPLTWKPQTRYE